MNGHSRTKKRLPPYTIYNRLVCSECKEYLTCDPVKILANNNVICGRCSRSQAPNIQAVRSAAFEDAASYFLYPCKNDKCNRLLERQEVPSHEVKCEFEQSGCCSCWRRCTSDNPPTFRPQGVYQVTADDKTHELITCAHCFGYLSAKPIFIRTNGTYICYRCGPDLQEPPVIRDEPLETLLECFIIKCSYRMNGCEERFRFGEDIVEHEATCDFNPHRQFHQPRYPDFEGQGRPGGKIKGVISTISSGHIYATITPNHFYGQHMDETMMRELQHQQQQHSHAPASPPPPLPGAPLPLHRLSTRSHSPSEQNLQMPKVHGHTKQGSFDKSARSSISMENHRWDVYTGWADDGKRNDKGEDDAQRKYLPKVSVKGVGVARNESILYNNVVTEMKYKQKSKHVPNFP